ncbi:MAG TPA: hypothetical protein PKD79_04450, partial [Candidatus Doudnabacteria bacterium]|nr:hypothetical protein [Candidatus Doudnabacteria bacterium]
AQLTERSAPGSEPGSGGSDASILPYPEGYRFVYEGAEISELAEVHNVLKRQKPVQTESVVSRIIRIFSFGLIDLTRFNNTRIQNFAFIEDKEYGLGVNVDLNYGNVNIYQNWEKWPQLGYGCEGLLDEQVFMELERRGQAENGSYEYCGVLPRISEGDIPSDDEAIAIARQFVSDYGVSMEGYGEPRVYEYYPWRIAYEQATNKTSFYFPENVQVLFPLVLEGQSVYDEGGHPTGMTVNIDVRTRLVNGMYGLETKQFQRSEYKGETDANRLLQIAERGGYRNGFWDGGSNIATLRLDTPTIEMVRIWYSVDPMNQGEELLVPSLVFPIKNATENNYWRKTIIVPLVRDLLDNENQGWGPIMPMPAPDPRPVEPDGGIGDTPVSTEPNEVN